jgi:lipopolysaccharide assembly protein A
MQALVIILLALAILLVIFTLQNSMGISIHVFFWQIVNAPLALVLLICIVLGYLLASIYFIPKIWKLKNERNQLKRLNTKLNQANPKQPQFKENPEGIEFGDEDENSFFETDD